MGEKSALEASMVGNMGAPAFLHRDVYQSFAEKAACLHIFHADRLKYIHLDALCNINCKLSAALEAALTIKTSRGDKTHDS